MSSSSSSSSSSSWVVLFLLLVILAPVEGGRATGVNWDWQGGDRVGAAPSPEIAGICDGIIKPQGYKCQEFEVKTRDGYILSMQRIPEGRVGGGGPRRPVLLQHGVLMEYWSWSWDELVAYDMPATVDFVYSQTGQKLHFVGHSLGTLTALASFSEGRLLGQLRSAALLCPVAYLSHMTTPIGILAARAFLGEIISNLLGVAEFNPKGKIVSDFLHALCRNPGVDCYDLLRAFTGNNCCLNASTVDLFLKYEPQPTSTKNMVHLAQTFRDGVLTKYDYENKNMEYYGQSKPPIYNLSRIPNNFPLFLSYGGQDSLSDVRDVELLLDDLKFHDVDRLGIHYVKDYAHADFVMGVSAKQTVYNAIIAFFNKQ